MVDMQADAGHQEAKKMLRRELPEGYERLLSPRQVALIFGVDPKTVTRWAKQGRLKSVMTPGGHRRYSESQVSEFMRGLEGIEYAAVDNGKSTSENGE
jgi:excisionase family DNA binding protein